MMKILSVRLESIGSFGGGEGDASTSQQAEESMSVHTEEAVLTPKDKTMMEEAPASPSGVWDFFNNFKSPLSFEEGDPATNGASNTKDEASVQSSTCGQSVASQQDLAPKPQRLVDFFCVVGPQIEKIEESAASPSELHLPSKLIDCFPEARYEMDFPDELPTFCLPNGCQLSTRVEKPTLSTFVLTSSSGNRLHGTVLTTYEIVPLEVLCEAFWAGECKLPKWLEEPRPYYLPKSLVVISHHAFYEVQRKFLAQLHRIAASGISPLPLERYVANFVYDIPLPRQGAASIRWNCFTKDGTVSFHRPADNELPLVNFSYQPLFRCLSVTNVLTLWGVLLQEGRVVLQSENQALLTPVAEALTSLLFPLTWQGMYVPVLPSNMLDVLDAPVPFLVGLVGRSCPQPEGVVVCDLDQDIVHLGSDEFNQPSSVPQIPRNLVNKLKVELEDVADPLYLIPPCGTKGRITSAVYGLLENPLREPYANMVQVRDTSLTNTHRQYILSAANCVPDSRPLQEDDFILVGGERTKYQSQDPNARPTNRENGESGAALFRALRRGGRAIQARTHKALSFTPSGAARYDEEMEKVKDNIAQDLYLVNDVLAGYVRYAFLRFMVTLFVDYKDFSKKGEFKYAAFAESLTEMTHGNRLYVESVVKTQMFERFLVESSTRRKLFDEHVLLELNKKKALLPTSKKEETPFLDEQLAVKKIILPAAPCGVGVPKGITYQYESFPKLAGEEMVAHKTLDPVSALCHLGSDLFCGTDW